MDYTKIIENDQTVGILKFIARYDIKLHDMLND